MNGGMLYSHADIEREVVAFYTDLVGSPGQVTHEVNVEDLRRGETLTWEQSRLLIRPIYYTGEDLENKCRVLCK